MPTSPPPSPLPELGQRPSPPLSPPSRTRWVALHRLPCTDPDLGTDLCRAVGARPPGHTRLRISPLVDGSTGAPVHDPFILAADPSGMLLLAGSDDSAAKAYYFVCDALSNTVRQLPYLPADDTDTAGLVVSAQGDFMVARLCLPSDIGDTATLHCFSPETGGAWIQKPIQEVPFGLRFPWCTARVFSYKGKLWWADLSQGLLSCDVLSDQPSLQYIRFPNLRHTGPIFYGQRVRTDSSTQRCVDFSGGMLRYVVITTRARVPKIKLWTLTDSEEAGEWTLDYELSFNDIWTDHNYVDNGFPRKVPVFAFVHPADPQIVYFFHEDVLYSFDLRMKKLLDVASNDIETDEASSTFFLAWKLPPLLQVPLARQPRSAFDSIATCFVDAFDNALAEMEFHQFTMMALSELNKNITVEEKKLKVADRISMLYFDGEADEETDYAHLNFYAHDGSKKVLVFAEVIKKLNGYDSWTLSTCKKLTKNSHGGLRNGNLSAAGSKKRKRSLYCFACEDGLKHPKGGFKGGHGDSSCY